MQPVNKKRYTWTPTLFQKRDVTERSERGQTQLFSNARDLLSQAARPPSLGGGKPRATPASSEQRRGTGWPPSSPLKNGGP